MVTECYQPFTAKVWLTLLAALAWGLYSLCAPPSALAQAPSLSMDVQVGFDGYCYLGYEWRWCPVRIVVSNEGADIDGEIRVYAARPQADVYAVSASLPGHSRKAFYIYIPVDNVLDRLSVEIYAGGKVVLFQQVTVSGLLSRSDLLYGVISSQPSALNFLGSITPEGRRAVVALLDLATLPPNPLGWENLSTLILDDVDTAALDEERRQALETWVSHGGHLIVGGGVGAWRTAAGIAHLLPVTLEGTQPVENLEALAEWTGISVLTGPYAIAATSLREGEVVMRQGDLILWARRSYGAGQVDFLAFGAALNPFTRWEGQQKLWSSILDVRRPVAPVALRYTYSAREAAAAAIHGIEVPPVGQIALFLLIYVLLIGPLNYLVLRKLKRRELAWFTIPALTLGFTLFTYVTGLQLRGVQAVVHQLAAVYVPEGRDVGRVSSIVALLSPRRTAYDVAIANALTRRLPETDELARSLCIYQGQDGSLLRRLRVDIGGIRSLIADGYVKVSGVEADLKVISSTEGLILQGSLLNGEVPLSDAVVLTYIGEQRLGDLPAGSLAQISIPHDHFANQAALPERIVGQANYWSDRELYKRYQLIQALLSDMDLESGVYLLGWASSSPLSVEVVERPYLTVNEALYIYALPMEELRVRGDTSIPSSLFRRRIDSSAGDVSTLMDRFSLGESSQIVFSFSVWPGLEIQQVGSLVLSIVGSGNTLPEVSLWNKDTSGWEVVPVDWGVNVIPEGEAYLLPSGVIMVKLETGARQQVSVDDITVAIEGRR